VVVEARRRVHQRDSSPAGTISSPRARRTKTSCRRKRHQPVARSREGRDGSANRNHTYGLARSEARPWCRMARRSASRRRSIRSGIQKARRYQRLARRGPSTAGCRRMRKEGAKRRDRGDTLHLPPLASQLGDSQGLRPRAPTATERAEMKIISRALCRTAVAESDKAGGATHNLSRRLRRQARPAGPTFGPLSCDCTGRV
jgi:hypothetical protein